MVDDVYRDSIHIDAEPDVVYEYFTRPDALGRWMGDYAILAPDLAAGSRLSAATKP